ncbi:UNVERIFIED_CONTAM: hypothetical protein HDU68_000049 [Siphonaria sp. JEL0065]|nr:hypothetical protein HDU68_000049 [Siphonaria sp. JEL0065]
MAVDERPVLISNTEVLEFLKTCDIQDHISNTPCQYLRTVTFEVSRYLNSTVTKPQLSPDQSLKLAQELKALGLMKAEILMIVNNCPSSHVELYLMVEELGDRYSEDDVEKMLALIQEYVGAPQGQSSGEDVMEED